MEKDLLVPTSQLNTLTVLLRTSKDYAQTKLRPSTNHHEQFDL